MRGYQNNTCSTYRQWPPGDITRYDRLCLLRVYSLRGVIICVVFIVNASVETSFKAYMVSETMF